MKNVADLSVHQGRGANDFSSEHLADRLMAETDAKNGRRLMKLSNDVLCNACIRRSARSRRNHNARGLQPCDLFQRDLVVAINAQLFTQLAQILDEIVGEGIVVIDDENHSSNPRCARLIARIKARDLLTVSMYSFSGTESATMPPPA